MSENESKNSELAILLKTAARVEVIEERFDRHLKEMTDMSKDIMTKFEHKFEHTDKKLDELTEKITSTRIDAIEKHSALNTKMAGISGAITIIMYFITDFIHGIIKK